MVTLCLTLVTRRHRRAHSALSLGKGEAIDPGGRWPGLSQPSERWQHVGRGFVR
jgi:hypothetical protein